MAKGGDQSAGLSGLYGAETEAPVSLGVYPRAVWRRKWLAAALAVLVAGGGLLYTWLEKPVYEATALLVFTNRPSGAFHAEAVERVGGDLVNSQITLIRRSESLASLINDPELSLLRNEMFRRQADPADALNKRLKLLRLEGTSILSIGMTGEDPRLITGIVNKIANNRRANVEQEREASTATAIQEYTRKMADTESDLAKLDYKIWKRANDAAIPGLTFREQQKDGPVILKIFEQRRDQLQLQRTAITQQLDQVAAELAARDMQFKRLCDAAIAAAAEVPAPQDPAAKSPEPPAAGNVKAEPARTPEVVAAAAAQPKEKPAEVGADDADMDDAVMKPPAAAAAGAQPAEKPAQPAVAAVASASRAAEIYKALAAADAEADPPASGAPLSPTAAAGIEAKRRDLRAQLDQALNAISAQDQALQRTAADRKTAEEKLTTLMRRIDALEESMAVRREQLNPEAIATDVILRPLEATKATLDEQYQKERARLDSGAAAFARSGGEAQKVHSLQEAYAALSGARQFQTTAREHLAAVRADLDVVGAALGDISTDAAKESRLSDAHSKMEQWVREVKLALSQIAVNVYEASEPQVPIRPRWPINIAFSVLLGLMLGTGSTILLEVGRSTVKTPDDVSRGLAAKTLGVVPHLDGLDVGHRVFSIETCDDPHIDEAFNEIRFAIQSLGEGATRSFVVTSATVGEGKSTVATMLARSFARAGEKVLLVDGNLRAPYLHAVFNVPPTPGLATLIFNGKVGPVGLRSTCVPNLMLLPAGEAQPEKLAALQPHRIEEFLRTAQGLFDRVIFDATATIGVADVRALARGVGRVVYVVKAGHHKRTLVIRGLETLRRVPTDVLGVVLNNAGYTRGDYYHFRRRYIDRGTEGAPKSSEAHPGETPSDADESARWEFEIESPVAPESDKDKANT